MKVTRRTWIANPGGNGGAWQYHDDKEASFVFEMLMTTGIDISSIDSFIEGQEHPLPEQVAQHLAERRAEALQSYLDGKFDLAQIQVDALRNACLYYGENLTVAPRMKSYRKRVESARLASKAPRPARKLIDDDWVRSEHEKLTRQGVPSKQARSKLFNTIKTMFYEKGSSPSERTIRAAIKKNCN